MLVSCHFPGHPQNKQNVAGFIPSCAASESFCASHLHPPTSYASSMCLAGRCGCQLGILATERSPKRCSTWCATSLLLASQTWHRQLTNLLVR